VAGHVLSGLHDVPVSHGAASFNSAHTHVRRRCRRLQRQHLGLSGGCVGLVCGLVHAQFAARTVHPITPTPTVVTASAHTSPSKDTDAPRARFTLLAGALPLTVCDTMRERGGRSGNDIG
jgi:hypothetical protein